MECVVCVYIYVYLHTYIHIYIYTLTYIYIDIYIFIQNRRSRRHTQKCRTHSYVVCVARLAHIPFVQFTLYLYVYVYVYICICMYVHVYVYIYVYTSHMPFVQFTLYLCMCNMTDIYNVAYEPQIKCGIRTSGIRTRIRIISVHVQHDWHITSQTAPHMCPRRTNWMTDPTTDLMTNIIPHHVTHTNTTLIHMMYVWHDSFLCKMCDIAETSQVQLRHPCAMPARIERLI